MDASDDVYCVYLGVECIAVFLCMREVACAVVTRSNVAVDVVYKEIE